MALSTLTPPAARAWNEWSPKGVAGSALVDYHNCLKSLGIHNAQPYSPMRYASMLALINTFRWSNYDQRNQWVKYWQWCMNAREFEWECKSGDQRHPGDCDSITAKQFLDLSVQLWAPEYVVRHPWALTLKEFVWCWKVIKYGGKEPQLEEMNEAMKKVSEAAADYAAEKGREFAAEQIQEWAERFAAGAIGYATKAVVTAEALSGPIGWLVGLGVFIAQNVAFDRIKESILEADKEAYKLDAVRRGVVLASL